jgi:co-chaperonin GroES (HSP10)
MTISTTLKAQKPKLIVPKHVWDTKIPEKKKQELEKVPTPTGFRMVLYPLKLESKTTAGLHLTDETVEQSQITTNVCKVLKMGPDCFLDKQRFPSGAWCKEKDWVLITRYAGSRIKIEGGELRIVNDDEILAVIDDPRDILPANIL